MGVQQWKQLSLISGVVRVLGLSRVSQGCPPPQCGSWQVKVGLIQSHVPPLLGHVGGGSPSLLLCAHVEPVSLAVGTQPGRWVGECWDRGLLGGLPWGWRCGW